MCHMERYKLLAEHASHGWKLSCPAFGIVLDAGPDELDGAVAAMKSLMEREAFSILDRGDFLPADEPLPEAPSGPVIYVETDFMGTFVRKSEAVRRNVSVPGWIDLRLRRNNIDASRLFQDAALEKLAGLEAAGRGLRRISDASDLEGACASGVLDAYFEARLARVIQHGMKAEAGGERA